MHQYRLAFDSCHVWVVYSKPHPLSDMPAPLPIKDRIQCYGMYMLSTATEGISSFLGKLLLSLAWHPSLFFFIPASAHVAHREKCVAKCSPHVCTTRIPYVFVGSISVGNHPNIIRCYGMEDRFAGKAILLDYCNGGDLYQVADGSTSLSNDAVLS